MLITWLLAGAAWQPGLPGLGWLTFNELPALRQLNDTIRMLAYPIFLISVLPFIYLYNGQRGPSNWFTKYFFYAFFPSLWITYAFANGLLN